MTSMTKPSLIILVRSKKLKKKNIKKKNPKQKKHSQTILSPV